LYFIRKPNFVFSLPEINDRELKKARVDQQEVVTDFEKISEISREIMAATRIERASNAAKMKKRWDTSNTQQAKVGDYVLTEKDLHDKPSKKIKKKRKLGEALFVRPGIVTKVHANGTISVQWKESETVELVASNRFKVVTKEVFDSCSFSEVVSDESTTSSRSIDEKSSKEKENKIESDPLSSQKKNAPTYLPKSQTKKISKKDSLITFSKKSGDHKTHKNSKVNNSSSSSKGSKKRRFDDSSSTSDAENSMDSLNIEVSCECEEKYQKSTESQNKTWSPQPGLKVLIFWKAENKWYPGTVVKWSETEQKWFVNYECDGDKQYHKFKLKTWKVAEGNNARVLKSIYL
jgi:hypothetical protein